MLSLKKVYNIEELQKWCQSVIRSDDERFIIEPKFDGIAAFFNNDILSTSGTGNYGFDISDKINIINNIPTENNKVGELIILKSKFNNLKKTILKKDGKPYAIERSMVSGIINTDNFNYSEKIIEFIDYDKYKIGEFRYANFLNNTLFHSKFNELIDKVKKFDYPLDGIVIKLADEHYRKALGGTADVYKGQIAFKFGNPTGKTILKDIVLQCGKQHIAPVGIIEDCFINGINNTRISLHNFKTIIEKNINIGDHIEIERCGEIIPQYKQTLIKVNEGYVNLNNFMCPACFSALIYEEPHLKCSNQNCHGNLLKRIRDGVIKLNIKELGQKTINTFYENGIITNFLDIFNLDANKIVKLPGFSVISTNKIINEIKKIQNSKIQDYRVLAATCPPGFGLEILKTVLTEMHISVLLKITKNNFERVSELPMFDLIRTTELFKFLITNRQFIIDLFNLFPNVIHSSDIQEEERYKRDNTTNTNFTLVCFTQDDPFGKTRNELVEIAKKINFIAQDNVTKQTKVLVCANKYENTSKIKKAIKYNINIMEYSDFYKLLLQNNIVMS